MELCSSSMALKLKPHLSPPSFLSLNAKVTISCHAPLLQFKNKASNPHKLSSLYHFLQHPIPKNSNRVKNYASSSSVAPNTEQDRLPADLAVSEIQEPNSRVRLSVEVPPAVCEDCYKRVLKEFMKQAKVLFNEIMGLPSKLFMKNPVEFMIRYQLMA